MIRCILDNSTDNINTVLINLAEDKIKTYVFIDII